MKSSKLPMQAAPVQRYIAGAPISSENGNGVEASFWGALLKGAATAIPAIVNAVSGD